MTFRFLSVLVFVVFIGLVGNLWERRCLDLHRAISRQHFRLDILKEQEVRSRLLAESLSTPERLSERRNSHFTRSPLLPRVGHSSQIGSAPSLERKPQLQK